MYYFLEKIGKDVRIISSDPIQLNLSFLPNIKKIETVDMEGFDYSNYDLFIVLDSSTFDQAIGIKSSIIPKISMVVIDHHKTNTLYGNINLVDYVGSTCEVLYNLFKDINFEVGGELAMYLLTGIISDTGSFRFDYTTPQSFTIAHDLIKKGADRQKIIFNLFNSYEYDLMKFWGKLLDEMQFDQENHFVWTAIPYETFSQCGMPEEAKSLAATLFFSSVKNTDFGIVLVEQSKGILNMSFRARKNMNVSKIAKNLGGSGHPEAAGGYFEFENFNEAVEKVIKVARKYAKKNKKI